MFWSRRGANFKHLAIADEDSESLISDTPEKDHAERPPYRIVLRPWTLIFFIFLTAASTYAFSISGSFLAGTSSIREKNRWLNHLSNYCKMVNWIYVENDLTFQLAPVLDDVEIEYSTTRFNGSLMHENIYRQAASPAVDEAWQALGVDCSSPRPFPVPSLTNHRPSSNRTHPPSSLFRPPRIPSPSQRKIWRRLPGKRRRPTSSPLSKPVTTRFIL